MKDLSNYRKSYDKSELLETSIPEDPINLFNRWFHEVEDFGGVDEVNAMTVATIGLDGFPKSRVVLLKKFNEEGFVFYTNYNSQKGRAIAANPNVCLSFFWHSMERQVIERKFEGKEIPRPDFWGGFLVIPHEVEFWQGRPNRLHDRIQYVLQEDYSWSINRLSP